LIGVGRAEQEEILVRLTEIIDRPVTEDGPTSSAAPPPKSENSTPLLEKMPLSDCLLRLDCQSELVAQVEDFIREWIVQRVSEDFGEHQAVRK
jgi:hypothetical protein